MYELRYNTVKLLRKTPISKFLQSSGQDLVNSQNKSNKKKKNALFPPLICVFKRQKKSLIA